MQAKENFKLIRKEFIPEYKSDFLEYEHIKTKARLFLIQNDDENKVFNISFRTPVSDSTGVPHILEHSVLNGSKKYPVKEPFVELIKSSQATFINAMTYPDRTCYPVSSANKQDLYNLTEVYLDAVFAPNINKQTFQQEGWHYDQESSDSEMIIKGVVYNEMKGVYSNPDSLYNDTILNNLFPDNTYQFDSGGNPDTIPDLTYEQFIGFYKKFYHPTNSYIFYYGDDKSDKIFEMLEEYLGKYEYSPNSITDSTIQQQKLTSSPKSFSIEYDPGDNSEAKSQTSICWLFPEKYSKMEMGILEYLLLGNSSSPLYKKLIDSGLGAELSTGTGGEYDLIQSFFTAGLKNVEAKNCPDVIDIVNQTLLELAKNGFTENQLKAAINITEFSLREYNTGSQPKGLSIILEMVSNWIYDVDPLPELKFEDEIKKLKTRTSHYFQQMITDLFIENQNRLILASHPKKGLNEAIEAKESKRILDYKNPLSEAQLLEEIKKTNDLLTIQNQKDSPEDLSKLPKLEIADLPKKSTMNVGDISNVDGVELVYSAQNTSGINYLSLSFNIVDLPLYYYQYIPLLASTFTKISTKNHTQESLNEFIDIYTGGLYSETFNTESDNGFINRFSMNSKTTNENLSKALEIINEIAFEQILDNPEKIKQILDETISGFESDIVASGSSYGSLIISSGLNKNSQLGEIKNGISQLNFLRSLQNNFKQNWSQILTDLIELKKYIFTKDNLLIGLTATEKTPTDKTNVLAEFISKLPGKYKITDKQYQFQAYSQNTAIIIPTKVNFVCQGVNLYNLGYEYSGDLLAINKMINVDYLWNTIRAKGGAYGSRGGFDKYDGEYIITSWRDPNSTNTLDAYNNIANYLENKKLSDIEINNLVVNMIGTVDRYQTASQKGYSCMVNHLMGKKIDKLQKERDEIFSFNQDSLGKFAKHLKDFNKTSRKVVFTDKKTAEKLGSDFTKISILEK